MLTARQMDLSRYIHQQVSLTGLAPTYSECSDALGITKSNVARLLKGLEDRGFIRHLPRKARAIEIIKEPPEIGIPITAAAKAVLDDPELCQALANGGMTGGLYGVQKVLKRAAGEAA
jgi:repressor LexA